MFVLVIPVRERRHIHMETGSAHKDRSDDFAQTQATLVHSLLCAYDNGRFARPETCRRLRHPWLVTPSPRTSTVRIIYSSTPVFRTHSTKSTSLNVVLSPHDPSVTGSLEGVFQRQSYITIPCRANNGDTFRPDPHTVRNSSRRN